MNAGLETTSQKGRAQDAANSRPGRTIAGSTHYGKLLASIAGGARDETIAKAQDIMYDAWEQTNARSRIALARKALGVSPLCADAYNLLADEASSLKEAGDLYAKGVEAGELALGPEGFEEYAGRFWGFLETRPYI